MKMTLMNTLRTDMDADQDEVMDFEDDDLLGDYVVDQKKQIASDNAPSTTFVLPPNQNGGIQGCMQMQQNGETSVAS